MSGAAATSYTPVPAAPVTKATGTLLYLCTIPMHDGSGAVLQERRALLDRL